MLFLHRYLTLTLSLLAVAPVVQARVSQRPPSMPYIKQADLSKYLAESSPSDPSDDQWFSISKDIEFMPNTNLPPLPNNPKYRDLGEGSTTGAWDEYSPYSVQPFVEGMSEYDEYQQAWRMLGFMIDCNPDDDDDNSGGSGSEDATEDGCARYVLWAAYVDLDYEGGGIAEYQYWDRNTQQWNDTYCYYAEDGSGDNGGDGDNDDGDNDDGGARCAKMDCHLDDTHFSVLGFFKHRNYDDWMEQLFKHEGYCVWTEDEYEFMSEAREAWPQGCIDSGSTTEEGEELYYNIKPLRSGRIGLGLYTDTQCLEEYSVSTDTLEDIIGNLFSDARSGSGSGGSGSEDNDDYSSDSLADSLDRWHSAFDVWHICQPCVAYDLENSDGSMYVNDDAYYYNNGRRKLGGEYYGQGDAFECYDDAGYTNVNQCMKFSAKTVMKTATFRDLSLARYQQTLVKNPLSGFFKETDHYQLHTMGNIATYIFFAVSILAFVYALINLCVTAKAAKDKQKIGESKKSLLK